ncbi:BA14K family protein [Microvirga sp. 2TAF3]
MALQNGDLQTSYSQWRDRNGWYGRPGYVARPYYGRGYYYGRPGYYRRDYGSAAAAGAIGLATGAIIGGAIAQSQAAPVYTSPNGAVAYCAQRFKSYDPASGTYLGYDGLRHACP